MCSHRPPSSLPWMQMAFSSSVRPPPSESLTTRLIEISPRPSPPQPEGCSHQLEPKASPQPNSNTCGLVLLLLVWVGTTTLAKSGAVCRNPETSLRLYPTCGGTRPISAREIPSRICHPAMSRSPPVVLEAWGPSGSLNDLKRCGFSPRFPPSARTRCGSANGWRRGTGTMPLRAVNTFRVRVDAGHDYRRACVRPAVRRASATGSEHRRRPIARVQLRLPAGNSPTSTAQDASAPPSCTAAATPRMGNARGGVHQPRPPRSCRL